MARVLRAAVGGGLVAEPRCFGLLSHDVALLSAIADQTWSGPEPRRIKFPFASNAGAKRHWSVSAGRLNWVGCGPNLVIGGGGRKVGARACSGDKAGLWSRKDKGAIGGKRSEAKERQASRKAEMRVRRDRK